ncbi:hypothetical protein E2C01_062208 [Portunus trituberculatus]|uniref:Ribosome-recycling factor, mitochondrial n=1 Tax=Portunus trituberculatus TaxID=210409 RepID=A0A5B7HGG3_PORTR|nr:hypothetical protein [Portunus trituberculatus]
MLQRFFRHNQGKKYEIVKMFQVAIVGADTLVIRPFDPSDSEHIEDAYVKEKTGVMCVCAGLVIPLVVIQP